MEADQSAKILGVSITPSSASQRLCGRIWFVGDGAFAPEVWVRSASRPYLGPFDSRGFASFAGLLPKRQRTAVATMLPSPCPCATAGGFGLWETARSRLSLGSARRAAPTLGLSIYEDLCHSRAAPETAEDCRCYNAPSVPPRLRESPCFFHIRDGRSTLFAALGLGGRIC